MWFSWGMSTGQFTVAEAAQRARLGGYAWALIEYDDYGNDARWGAFRDACHAENVMPGVWFTDGGNISRTPTDATCVVAEHEGPGDYDGILREQGSLPAGMPRAVCTNFGTPLSDSSGAYHPEAAAPLIAGGWRCLTESYLSDNSQATPPRLDYTAKKLGWDATQPVFGVYGGATLQTYDEWAGWPGWSAYLAEYLWA